MAKLISAFVALTAMFAFAQTSSAQWNFNRHSRLVPHTTTHNDYVRHGNHIDVVPHTTTHYDRVSHNSLNFRYQPYRRSRSCVPHTTTHIDYVRHNGHYDAVPHTTTHYDRVNRYSRYVPHSSRYHGSYRPRYVPHTTTHIDYVPHNGHIDAVPHTTTHWHRN